MAAVRVAAVVLAVGFGFVVAAAHGGRSALFFFFEPTAATPGDRVAIRTAGTPLGFRPSKGTGPPQRPMRLYLVENAVAGKVRSRFDQRLHFVGSLRPDGAGRGGLRFTVPPLDAGSYAAAAWCPDCARSSRGRRFFVLGVGSGVATRHRSRMLLRVTPPADAAQRCPVTIPNGSVPTGLRPSPEFHGNGALWARLQPDGVYVSPGADGSLFEKMIWGATGVDGLFSVRYEKLDGPASVLSAETVRGTWHGFQGTASWASRMHFSEGCWKVTGRVRDVSLSFVLEVVRPPGA